MKMHVDIFEIFSSVDPSVYTTHKSSSIVATAVTFYGVLWLNCLSRHRWFDCYHHRIANEYNFFR